MCKYNCLYKTDRCNPYILQRYMHITLTSQLRRIHVDIVASRLRHKVVHSTSPKLNVTIDISFLQFSRSIMIVYICYAEHIFIRPNFTFLNSKYMYILNEVWFSFFFNLLIFFFSLHGRSQKNL